MDDPALREAQMSAIEAPLGDLLDVVGVHIAGRYRDGVIEVVSNSLRDPIPSP
jgi:hypothetical protein